MQNDKIATRARIARRFLEAKGITAGSGPTVSRLLGFLDEERASSAPGIMRLFLETADAARSDDKLSALGQREKVQSAARSRLGNVGAIAKEISKLEHEHEAAQKKAVQIPEADAAQMLLDLEIAKHVRGLDLVPTQMERLPERLRVALVRLPAELTGITVDTQARIAGSLVSPDVAVQLGEEAEALQYARRVVQLAINELGAHAGVLSAREALQTFGPGWEVPGVLASRVNALAADSAQAA